MSKNKSKKKNDELVAPKGYRVKCADCNFEQFYNAQQRDDAYQASNAHMNSHMDHSCKVYKIF